MTSEAQMRMAWWIVAVVLAGCGGADDGSAPQWGPFDEATDEATGGDEIPPTSSPGGQPPARTESEVAAAGIFEATVTTMCDQVQQCSAYRGVVSAWLALCDVERYSPVDQAHFLLHPSRLRVAVEGGEILYDLDQMEACLAYRRSLSCQDVASGLLQTSDEPSCTDMRKGLRREGESCLSAWSCEPGLRCFNRDHLSCSEGVCVQQGAWKSCYDNDYVLRLYCGADERCNLDDDGCEPALQDGERCVEDDDCMQGSGCLVDDETRFRSCAPYVFGKEGEPCNRTGLQCSDGLRCRFLVERDDPGTPQELRIDFDEGRCLPPPRKGEACVVDWSSASFPTFGYPESSCADGTLCEVDSIEDSIGRCVEYQSRREGELCLYDASCAEGLVCKDDRCITPVPRQDGESCAGPNDVCVWGGGCDETGKRLCSSVAMELFGGERSQLGEPCVRGCAAGLTCRVGRIDGAGEPRCLPNLCLDTD